MEAFEFSFLSIVLLVIAAVAAGYIDTLVGGGGLITIPALMLSGVPPIYALGTNKLQAVVGSGTASFTLFRYRKLQFPAVKWLMLCAFLGSMIGALLVQFVDASVLNVVIPVVIVLIAVYFLVAPQQVLNEHSPRIGNTGYSLTAVPAVGFYDGMFGPGTGSFFVWAGVSLRGQQIVYATMVAKSLNFATNLAALIVFVMFGKVLWFIAGLMMVGQFVGASLGARALMTINPSVLRYLVIALCFIILLWWALKS